MTLAAAATATATAGAKGHVMVCIQKAPDVLNMLWVGK
jgi:hypothetical protein